MDITFKCDKCEQPLTIDETGAGSTIDCPQCSASIVVPNKLSTTLSEKPRKEGENAVMNLPAQSSPTVMPAPQLVKSPVLTEEPKTKYSALSVGSGLLRVGALLTIVSSLYYMFGDESPANYVVMGTPEKVAFFAKIHTGLLGVGAGLAMWVVGEVSNVFIDIEANTRATRLLHEKQNRS